MKAGSVSGMHADMLPLRWTTAGAFPMGTYADWARIPDGGAPGWGGMDQLDQPITDQWTYQATSAVVLANSLLRTQPQVDPDRIGLTGISWGGYLSLASCLAWITGSILLSLYMAADS